jgi:predicted dehydrogenase
MCEKPLAMDAAESAELVALARRHPRQAAGVNYNVRYYPLCVEARSRSHWSGGC